jgi:hypothetical protein
MKLPTLFTPSSDTVILVALAAATGLSCLGVILVLSRIL